MKTVSGEDRSRSASGLSGFTNVTGETVTGLFNFLVPDDADATFSAVSQDGDDLASATRTQGIPVAGLFTSVTASSGTVRAYFVVGK